MPQSRSIRHGGTGKGFYSRRIHETPVAVTVAHGGYFPVMVCEAETVFLCTCGHFTVGILGFFNAKDVQFFDRVIDMDGTKTGLISWSPLLCPSTGFPNLWHAGIPFKGTVQHPPALPQSPCCMALSAQ